MTIFLCIILFWSIVCAAECSMESKRLRRKNKELEQRLRNKDAVIGHLRRKKLTLEAEVLRQNDILRRMGK